MLSQPKSRGRHVANPHNFLRHGYFNRRISDHRTLSVADRPRDQKTAALAAHMTRRLLTRRRG